MKFRLKLFLSMLILFVVISIALYIFIYQLTFKSMRKEADKISLSFVLTTKNYIINDVLIRDTVKVEKVLNEIKSTNEDIVYMYILGDDNKIFASTFGKNIPYNLINLNKVDRTHNIKILKHKKDIIHDVGIKMLEGLNYEMHIGFSETGIKKVFKTVAIKFLMIFVILILILLLISYYLSGFLTRPLEQLYIFSQELTNRKFGKTISTKGSLEIKRITENLNQLSQELHLYEENFKSTINKLVITEKMNALHTIKSGILHEIKSSITSIKLLLSALDENSIKNTDIQVIKSEVKNIEQLLKDFVTDINEQEVEVGYLNIRDIIETVLKECTFISNKKIEVETIFPENIQFIKGYYTLLKHLFYNLIRNSYDAIDNEGKITIQLKYHDRDSAEIIFSDNGHGIENINMNKIFDPFFTTKRDGTGMGLYIVYNIVTIHHGKIEVKSTKGNTTFFITLRGVK